MPSYITQQFMSGTNTHVFYAEQNDHNHDKANDFTKVAKALMDRTYPKPATVEQGKWKKGQSKPTGSHLNELKWNEKSKKWEQK